MTLIFDIELDNPIIDNVVNVYKSLGVHIELTELDTMIVDGVNARYVTTFTQGENVAVLLTTYDLRICVYVELADHPLRSNSIPWEELEAVKENFLCVLDSATGNDDYISVHVE